MLVLYASSGAGGFTVLQPSPFPEQARLVIANAARLLRSRGQVLAADHLVATGFSLADATNHFNDEFSVLQAVVSLERYEHLRIGQSDPNEREAFKQIASTITELGTYVRFVAVEMAMEAPLAARGGVGLTTLEIKRLVQKWVGVSGGYLGDFSYAAHAEFYVDLGLSIDPYQYEGTTRERFIKILEESPPETQAAILEGILARFPAGSAVPQGSGADRTPEMGVEIRAWISRLRGTMAVASPSITISSAVVDRALRDAEELLAKNGPTSCVDRLHTVLHGYMRDVCLAQGLDAPDDAPMQLLLKTLREKHPALTDLGPRPDDVVSVLRAFGAVVDKLNPLRNNASVAHPNAELLDPAEAMLVVNAVRTILHYLEAKLHPGVHG